MPMIVDTHAHLDSKRFKGDREDAIARAAAAGVTRIINVGANMRSSEDSVAMAHVHDGIWASVGVHPHYARSLDDAAMARLGELAADPRVLAIGEMGLDYYRNLSPREIQIAAFRQQFELARAMGKPVIIHSRDADDEMLAILREYGPATGEGEAGVLHCFAGDLAMAQAIIELGYLLGIDGPVTYKNSAKLVQVVAGVPLGSLLLETDCPYLTPHPHRGKRNEPAHVSLIAQRVAEITGVEPERVAGATTANAARLFGAQLVRPGG